MPRSAPLIVCLLGLLLVAAPAHADPAPWGTGESQGEDLVVSLVTFSPGDDVASWWGHGSLVVEDRRLQHARLYNYGMFSFDDAMLRRYAMGRLEFWVADASPARTFRAYQRLGRDVRIQELNLTPAQRLEVSRLLAENVLPQNRDYLYHHYNDNCVTRLRDMIDRAVGGQLQQFASAPGRMTLREHTRRYTAVSPPMSVLLDFLMNDEIDRPITRWQEAFLPDELERQVADLQVVGPDGQKAPLVAKSWNYFKSDRPPPPEQPPGYAPWMLALGLAVGASAVGLAYWGRGGGRLPRILLGLEHVVVGLVLGLPGTALFIMGSFTDHTVTYWNENLFLANPLTLLMLPLGIMVIFGSTRARAILRFLWQVLAASGVLGLALKVLPMFDQDNWRLIALILPISLGFSGAFNLDQLLAEISAARREANRPRVPSSLKTP
ncbi:MAG: DUF4105 domain-containing protein [Myxococcaceae bacterium]|nr:DUF4105 domain-containing protein [Myxococcaceae bacterium]